MRYKLLLALLTIGLFINAQDIAFKKKNFEDQEAFKVAQKNLKDGNKKYISKSYSDALPYFLKANEFNPNNAELNFKIGISYLKSEEQEKSLSYFKKAKELDPKVHPLLEFGLAQGNQYNKQYADAISGYNIFLDGLSSAEKGNYEAKVNEKIKECEAAGGKNTITEAPVKEEPKEVVAEVVKEEPKKEEVKEVEAPKPFDPEKKEEYKPVNAHPVNTEVEKKEEPVTKTVPIVAKPVEKKVAPVNTTSEIVYKVQVSSSSRKLTAKEKKELYNGTVKLEEILYKGSYKYVLGNFKTKDDAIKFRSKLGVKGAFIVKFKDGKRI